MAKSQFDRLVESLSSEERQEMLRKIKETYPVSSEPLAKEEEERNDSSVDPIEYYYKADIITKIIVFLTSLFTGKDKGDVILETFLGRLKRQLSREYSLFFNIDKNLGLKPFYNLMFNLDKALIPFRAPLEAAMDEKIDFYIFLTNRVLGKRDREILNETDPLCVEKEFPEFSVSQIHRQIEDNYELIMRSLDEEKQRRLTLYSIIFRQLHGLSVFDFSKCLSSFSTTNPGDMEFCDLEKIKSDLISLNNILSSFQQPPDITLLQAIFLFSHRKELTEGTIENLEESLQGEIGLAIEGLNSIRNFNKKIPLTALLRVLSNNINYNPTQIGGGEGALRHYQTYLKNTISEKFRLFVNDKKKRDIIKTLSANWGISFIEPLIGYQGEKFDGALKFTFESSLALLDYFLKKIIQKKYFNTLNMLQINGDFYRRDNRAEFTETYENLQELPDRLRNFSKKFLVDGYYFNSLTKLFRTDYEGDAESDLETLVKLTDKEANEILTFALDIFSSLASLLKGIILGTGGAYDTLSNYSDLGGSRNRDFKNELASMEFLTSNFHKSLIDVISYEEKSNMAN
jgi:hypothetical protein